MYSNSADVWDRPMCVTISQKYQKGSLKAFKAKTIDMVKKEECLWVSSTFYLDK